MRPRQREDVAIILPIPIPAPRPRVHLDITVPASSDDLVLEMDVYRGPAAQLVRAAPGQRIATCPDGTVLVLGLRPPGSASAGLATPGA